MELADIGSGEGDGVAQFGGQRGLRFAEIFRCGGDVMGGDGCLVELAGKAGEGRVAFVANGFDNGARLVEERCEIVLGTAQEIGALHGGQTGEAIKIYDFGHGEDFAGFRGNCKGRCRLGSASVWRRQVMFP